MKEVKSPKKPMAFYYIIAILVILLLNAIFFPNMAERKVKEVDYGVFKQMIEKGDIGKVQIEQDKITFSDKDEKNYFKTGPLNDPNLIQELDEKGITKYGSPIVERTSPILAFIISWVLPIVLMVALGQLLMRQMSKRMGDGGMGNAMSFGKSNAKIYVQSETGIKFKDVAGEDEAKELLLEIVDFLHNPEKYTEIGAKMPKGALLVGPPGTGRPCLPRQLPERQMFRFSQFQVQNL